jgi:hypothetical protein
MADCGVSPRSRPCIRKGALFTLVLSDGRVTAAESPVLHVASAALDGTAR